MVAAVGNFTLQPMACTNHKFPHYGEMTKSMVGKVKWFDIAAYGLHVHKL